MKKKYILLSSAAAVLTALIIISAWYFTPKTFLKNVNADEVKSISVFSGSTGENFSINDEGEIRYIVENIKSIKMKRDKVSAGYDGFGFSLSFKDKNNNVIDSFIINGEKTVRDDPFFYRADGGLCVDYITAIAERLSPNE